MEDPKCSPYHFLGTFDKLSPPDRFGSVSKSNQLAVVSRLSQLQSTQDEEDEVNESPPLKDRGKLRDWQEDSHNSGRNSTRVNRNSESLILSDVSKMSNLVPYPKLGGEFDGIIFNVMFLLAGLVIKAVGFQINLMISFITFPIWLLHFWIMLVTNPFRVLNWARNLAYRRFSRLCKISIAILCPILYQQIWGKQSIGTYVSKFVWGCLWLFYACIVLIGVFIMAFVTSGIMIRWFVEEPVRMKETLNFDYTRASPDAFVPIVSCDGVSASPVYTGDADAGKWPQLRIIPPNHKLKVMITLTMPESDYNRRLGVFQVRLNFMSLNSKVTATSIHPSMLRFKSLPLRYVETFLKTASLITGYSSESQTLNLRMTGLTEGIEPTACLRVILEQRAEYKPGAGIPEIYAASLILESELPLLKKIIWSWRKIILIWLTMWTFLVELLLILVCCRGIIIPKGRRLKKV